MENREIATTDEWIWSVNARSWFEKYAVLSYAGKPGTPGVELFADVCMAAVKRGNSLDPLRDYAEESGMKEYVAWFELRRMLGCLRPDEEVRNSVQLFIDFHDDYEDVKRKRWEEYEN